MPSSFDPNLADYPLYLEGYDHGVADADRAHRHDAAKGMIVGVVATCIALRFAPYLFAILWH